MSKDEVHSIKCSSEMASPFNRAHALMRTFLQIKARNHNDVINTAMHMQRTCLFGITITYNNT